jgi:hypothetical protein
VPNKDDQTIKIPPEHSGDVEVDIANTHKFENQKDKTEQCQVRFKVITDKPIDALENPFTISVI